jgi:patatin-like phospholipase/acyl hydrolase
MEISQRVGKILSLDGGGVRGLSALIILDYVMEMLGNMGGARLEPWREFDMIAGTGTGGLIDMMLGLLRISVADLVKAYKDSRVRSSRQLSELVILQVNRRTPPKLKENSGQSHWRSA